VQALLSAPNPDDPLAIDVAKHYKEDEKDAQRVSKEWTEIFVKNRTLGGAAGILQVKTVPDGKCHLDNPLATCDHWNIIEGGDILWNGLPSGP